jgi:transcription initiation factor TFIIB
MMNVKNALKAQFNVPHVKKMTLEEVLNPQDTEYKYFCYKCNEPIILMEDGMQACSNTTCNILYSQTLDFSPEWKFYGTDDKNSKDPSRCGQPVNPLLRESSMGCKVLCGSKCSYEMRKIQKWTEWQSMPQKEKTLYDEFQFIQTMATNAGINKVIIDLAMELHKQFSEQQMFRGENRDAIKAAAIYNACKQLGYPRTAHEISKIFMLDKNATTQGCTKSTDMLHMIDRNLDHSRRVASDANPSHVANTASNNKITSSDFIERFCSFLNVPSKLTMLATFISFKINQLNLIDDITPHAVASGIIYFVSIKFNLGIGKKQIQGYSDVSEVTINKCYKKLLGYSDILIPPIFLEQEEEKRA